MSKNMARRSNAVRTDDLYEGGPFEEMARPAGLDPATVRLEGGCSIQLSYGRAGDAFLMRMMKRCNGKTHRGADLRSYHLSQVAYLR